MEITGTITKILPIEKGASKSGKEWQKQLFIVETSEKYNNLYAFELFGEEKIEKLEKFNKVGDNVTVKFNVSTNEWNGKYYTSLQAWFIEKEQTDEEISETIPTVEQPDSNFEDDNSLPF